MHNKMSVGKQVLTHIFVWGPLLALGWGIFDLWNSGVDLLSLELFLIFFFVSGLGVTVGFHRHFTHGSFKTFPVIRYILAAFGMFAAEMSLFGWVAHHRAHHQFSDVPGDPHSPHIHEEGWWGRVKGFFHAHMGWFSKKLPGREGYIGDLLRDRGLRVVNALFPLWVVLGLILPALIAFAFTLDWNAALLGFVWGGVVRLWAVYHLTWSINSICHIWGYRRFNTRDHSVNNPILGVLGFGEGWHNNHHKLPTSARHGLRWWEVDLSWYVIWLMKKFHLAWDLHVPTREKIEAVMKKPTAT